MSDAHRFQSIKTGEEKESRKLSNQRKAKNATNIHLFHRQPGSLAVSRKIQSAVLVVFCLIYTTYVKLYFYSDGISVISCTL